ncbi:Abi family protein [Brevibacillus sp. H7]|uniref:Abi family protein n=1 Tax=Brevibacillus sp. H7 TaxID=3349138 RepID=UPI00381BD116
MEEKKRKPALTFDKQLALLKERKLIVEDESHAMEKLKSHNYYRLSAYMKPFMNGNSFRAGTNFDQIIQLYDFDKNLRHLILTQLEPVEIAMKTQVAYLLAIKYDDSLSYKNKEYFANEVKHEEFIKKFEKELEQASKVQTTFILHHMAQYGGQVPVWAAVEMMSFGTISQLFKNMLEEDKQAIAKGYFGHRHNYLSSWLYTLSYVRNIIAHHARLFNKTLTFPVKLSDKDKRLGYPRMYGDYTVDQTGRLPGSRV